MSVHRSILPVYRYDSHPETKTIQYDYIKNIIMITTRYLHIIYKSSEYGYKQSQMLYAPSLCYYDLFCVKILIWIIIHKITLKNTWIWVLCLQFYIGDTLCVHIY